MCEILLHVTNSHTFSSQLGKYAVYRDSLFAGIMFSSFTAFAISYTTSWAIRTNTSTTYSMVGALNKLPVAISGILFIPSEKSTSFGNIMSVLLAFVAGLLYSYSQVLIKVAPTTKNGADDDDDQKKSTLPLFINNTSSSERSDRHGA